MEVYYRCVKGVAYGEDYGLDFCGVTCSEIWQGKPRLAVASDQTKLSILAILNASMSIEKGLLTVPFNGIKSCGVVCSFYIKIKWTKQFVRHAV